MMSDTFDANDFCDMTPPKITVTNTHFVDCWQLPGHEACAVVQMRRIRQVVNEQAWNEGLWFRAKHVTEDYLQCALRRLHAVIEGKG